MAAGDWRDRVVWPMALPILGGLSRLAARRSGAGIVAVTGSVGKSTTVSFIDRVLASTYSVRRNAEISNHRWGVMATFLGIEHTRSASGVLGQFPRLVGHLVRGPYPNYFLLEVGTGRPGEIVASLAGFHPDITVVTAVAAAHLEAFGSLEAIAQEKGTLVERLARGGLAVLRHDDPRVRAMADRTREAVVTFGFSPDASVSMTEPSVAHPGIETTLVDAHGRLRLAFPGLLNRDHLYAVMAAWCVGLHAGIDRERLAAVVQGLSPLSGRGEVADTRGGAVMFDDTWNANPASMRSALQTFRTHFGDRRTVLVLGDMLELGEGSAQAHEEAGCEAAFADVVVTVGKNGTHYARGVLARRPGAHVEHFTDAPAALAHIQAAATPGTAIFLKGSHGVRLGHIVSRLRAS